MECIFNIIIKLQKLKYVFHVNNTFFLKAGVIDYNKILHSWLM